MRDALCDTGDIIGLTRISLPCECFSIICSTHFSFRSLLPQHTVDFTLPIPSKVSASFSLGLEGLALSTTEAGEWNKTGSAEVYWGFSVPQVRWMTPYHKWGERLGSPSGCHPTPNGAFPSLPALKGWSGLWYVGPRGKEGSNQYCPLAALLYTSHTLGFYLGPMRIGSPADMPHVGTCLS